MGGGFTLGLAADFLFYSVSVYASSSTYALRLHYFFLLILAASVYVTVRRPSVGDPSIDSGSDVQLVCATIRLPF